MTDMQCGIKIAISSPHRSTKTGEINAVIINTHVTHENIIDSTRLQI